MEKLKYVACLTIVFVLMLAVGCTHMVVPKEYPVDQQKVPEFTADKPIDIINAQDKKEKVLLGTNIGHKFMGNLREFTDTAIDTLKTELNKRDIRTSQDAEKKLKVAVTKIHFESGFSGFSCDVTIRIETNDGYIGDVEGHDTNFWYLFPAIHGALNHAVVALLNDASVLAYLQR